MNETELAQEKQDVIQLIQTEPASLRRCGEQTLAFPFDLYLTPISRDQQVIVEQTIQVLGKQLSPQGLEFVHGELLPYRHIIASLRTAEGDWVGVLLELTWCRFVRRDTYENGGRILRAVESPLQQSEQACLNRQLSHAVPALYSAW